MNTLRNRPPAATDFDDEEVTRSGMRPTTRPTFDVDSFAQKTLSNSPGSTIPPSNTTPLDDFFVLPEQSFFQGLEAQSRRVELLGALLQAKGISPERGIRALQAALGAIVASAEGAQLRSLSSLANALAMALEELGITTPASRPARSLDVLVLDESEVSCDLVSLTVEAQGHIVRSATSYDEFVRQLDERLPEVIVTEAQLAKTPANRFAAGLADLLATRPVSVIFFSDAEVTIGPVANTNVRAIVSKRDGIEALMTALTAIVHQR